MENDTCIDEYLKRIEVNRPTNGPDKEYLIQLHIGHLTHIPFETFDLIDLKQLNISPDYIFDRLVRQNRGGVCFQMNGLFAFILKSLNYNVQLIPCSVYDTEHNYFYDDHSHLSLCVTLNNGEKMLCDVGFVIDFLTPLFFRTDCIQYATNRFFRLIETDDGLSYQLEHGSVKKDENISLPSLSSNQTEIIDINPECIKWTISYRFPIRFSEKLTKLDDFQDACPYIINTPDIILNHCSICRIHIHKPFIGAYSIVGKEFCESKIENGIEFRTRFPLSPDDDQELKKLLKEKFNLTIERKLELIG